MAAPQTTRISRIVTENMWKRREGYVAASRGNPLRRSWRSSRAYRLGNRRRSINTLVFLNSKTWYVVTLNPRLNARSKRRWRYRNPVRRISITLMNPNPWGMTSKVMKSTNHSTMLSLQEVNHLPNSKSLNWSPLSVHLQAKSSAYRSSPPRSTGTHSKLAFKFNSIPESQSR